MATLDAAHGISTRATINWQAMGGQQKLFIRRNNPFGIFSFCGESLQENYR
jgi:hypothetical protein